MRLGVGYDSGRFYRLSRGADLMSRSAAASFVLLFAHVGSVAAADGNRLAYLDGPLDPYYPHRTFPKLITPQWVGEDGVECVVTLAIDDMRESDKYEKFLRP